MSEEENKDVVGEASSSEEKSKGFFGFGGNKEEASNEAAADEAESSEEMKEDPPKDEAKAEEEPKEKVSAGPLDRPKIPEKKKPASLSAFVESKKDSWKSFHPTRHKKWSWVMPEKNILGAMAAEFIGFGMAEEKQPKSEVMNMLAKEIYEQMTSKKEEVKEEA